MLAELGGEAKRQGHARIFTEASITARGFFERHGYRVLKERRFLYSGVEFVNYAMEKQLLENF